MFTAWRKVYLDGSSLTAFKRQRFWVLFLSQDLGGEEAAAEFELRVTVRSNHKAVCQSAQYAFLQQF